MQRCYTEIKTCLFQISLSMRVDFKENKIREFNGLIWLLFSVWHTNEKSKLAISLYACCMLKLLKTQTDNFALRQNVFYTGFSMLHRLRQLQIQMHTHTYECTVIIFLCMTSSHVSPCLVHICIFFCLSVYLCLCYFGRLLGFAVVVLFILYSLCSL